MQALGGRHTVVTGAASGIGRAIATRLAGDGMRVVAADVEADALDDAVAELRAGGAEAIGVVTDVSDPAQVDGLAAAAVDAFGPVHVLVNNAGVGGSGRTWELELVDWHWCFGVCFWGAVHGIRSFVPGMIAHGDEAYVVNTSSMMGMGSAADRAAYETAKGALTALSEGLYFDLRDVAPQIHVTLLCPGYTRTRIRTARRNHPVRPEPDAVAAPGPGGADPAAIADVLLDAMAANRFSAFADADVWLPVIERRFAAVLAQRDPQPIRLDPR